MFHIQRIHSMPTVENVEVLYLRVRTLEKYKQNYELLCSQLGELNTQVGLQLQRHEMDVAALQGIIRSLEKDKANLQANGNESDAKIAAQALELKQDKEYTCRIHEQLTTAADLLKASERAHAERDREASTKINQLQHQLSIEANEKAALKRALALAEDQLKEQQQLRAEEAELLAVAKDYKRLKRKMDEQVQTIHDLQLQVDSGRQERERLQRELETARTTAMQLRRDVSVLSEEAESSKAHAHAVSSQLDQVEAQKTKWKAQLDDTLKQFQREIATIKTQLQHARDEKAAVEATMERKVRDLKSRWKQDREKLKKERESMRQENAKLRQEVHERDTECALARQKLEMFQQEVSTLQQVLDQVHQVHDDHRRHSRHRVVAVSDRHHASGWHSKQDIPPAVAESSSWAYTR
ncbi:unnamed protein product [Aphanomyces euteiches]